MTQKRREEKRREEKRREEERRAEERRAEQRRGEEKPIYIVGLPTKNKNIWEVVSVFIQLMEVSSYFYKQLHFRVKPRIANKMKMLMKANESHG